MAKSTRVRGAKLLYFLRNLDPDERIGLSAYLSSPLLANRPQLADLLDECWKQISEKALDLQGIHSMLFPDKTWSEKRARYLHLRLAQLLDHTLDFVALLGYLRDDRARYRYRLVEVARRGWEPYVSSTLGQAIKQLPDLPGSTDILGRLQLEITFNSFQSERTSDGTDTHLAEVLDHLDLYYYLQKLNYGCAALNGKLVLGVDTPLRGMETVLSGVENWEGGLPGVVKAYAACFSMLKDIGPKGDMGFLHLKEQLETGRDLPETEAKDLFTYALNYCTLRWYAGTPGFIEHYVALYEALLAQELLTIDGKLSKVYYKNIVALMCRLGKQDPMALQWAEQFVEDYKDRIAGDEENLTWLYNRAVLKFQREDYSGTISLLYNEINRFEDVLFGISARVYLCRALWMQEEWEGLGANLEAFRVFLGRNREITDRDKKLYGAFVKRFRRVLRIITGNPDRKQEQLLKVRKSLEAGEETGVFLWLREVVAEQLAL